MRAYREFLTGTCGVNLFHHFGSYSAEHPLSSISLGGAQLACAGFVDTLNCHDAYQQLAQRFNIVYQSTPRRNANSGRQFFFVVYDGKRN